MAVSDSQGDATALGAVGTGANAAGGAVEAQVAALWGGRTSWLGNGDLMGGDNGASLDELIVALKAQQTELFVALVGED